MTRSPLRAGVIGLGWAGQQHMAAYAAAEDVQLVAIAGMETDALAALGAEYGTEVATPNWQELVEGADLDLLSIATPTVLHGPMSIAALNAGIHVLSEKPMAENSDVARSMVRAAKDNDRVLEVSFNHRRRGDVAALKSVVDAGVLGSIYYAKAGWLRREGIPGLGSWFTRSALSGGGPLMDIGVHMLDMALHLLGEPQVKTATAATYAEFGPRGRGAAPAGAMSAKTGAVDATFDVEDLSTAFLRLDGGGTLLLETSWAQWIPKDQCYLTLYGSDGGASIDWGSPQDTHRNLRVWTEVRGVPAELQPRVAADGGHARCVLDFLAQVHSGEFHRYSGEEALRRAVIVDACYASARMNSEMTLE